MTCCEICLLRLGGQENKRTSERSQSERATRQDETPATRSNSHCAPTASADHLADVKKPHKAPRYRRKRPHCDKIRPKLHWHLNGILAAGAAASLLGISLLLAIVGPATSINRIDQNIYPPPRQPRAGAVSQNYEPSARSTNVRQAAVADHNAGAGANNREQEVVEGLASGELVASEERAGRDLVQQTSDERGESGPAYGESVSPAGPANQIMQPEQREQFRARRSSPVGERYAPPADLCADCLAIPLVVGPTGVRKQQSGPGQLDSATQGRRHYNRQQQQQQQQEPAQLRASPPAGEEQIGAPIGDHRSSEAGALSRQQHQQQPGDRDSYAPAAAMEVRGPRAEAYQRQTGWPEGDNQRQHHHFVDRPLYRKSYAYKHGTTSTPPPPPPPLPFEPKSDEKCPMTGPLTVCDQIGSYPADAILTKLEGAKMMFGQSYFNLDSLFSDESQHSSDPFEVDKSSSSAAAPASSGNMSAAIGESHHHATEPKTNIDHCAHQAGADTYYGRADRSGPIRSAHGEEPNVNSAPGGSQITAPTGATEPAAHHSVSGEPRSRHYQRRQRTYDDDGQAKRTAADGERPVWQQEAGLMAGPLDDSPGEMMPPRRRRQRPNSSRPPNEAQQASPPGQADASTRPVELVDEFLYLVERRGVRLRPADRTGGAPNSAPCNEAPVSNLREPDSPPMKLHRARAPKSSDSAAEHNDSHAASEADQLTNYVASVGTPADAVASLATTNTLAEAAQSSSSSAQLEGHNVARDTLELSPRPADDGAAAQLKVDADSRVTAPANTNTRRRKTTGRRRVGVGQTYVSAGAGGDADDTTTGPIASARLPADKTTRTSSPGAQKRAARDELSPVARRLLEAPLSSAARGNGSELDGQWTEQMQISSAAAVDESEEPGEPSLASQLQEEPKLRNKFAGRTRRQVPITFDNANRVARIDPERVELAARQPGEQVQPVCAARSIYISPRAALNDKKQWKYVVNAAERDPRVKQIIRVDICENPFGPCSDQVSLPLGFTSQCKQKYAKKKLLALDSRSGLLEVDTFFIPSCCVCQLILDISRPSGPMTPIDGGPPSEPISNGQEDNGEPASSSSPEDGANEASGT